MKNRFARLSWAVLGMLALTAAITLLRSVRPTMAGAEVPPVLVIDAGHGGADGGAVASDGTLESDVNLGIALRLEALARFCGVPTEMTRSTSEIDYPAEAETLAAKKKADQNARLALLDACPGAVLLSIHQNFYPAASPRGIQVFYGGAEGSRELAEGLQVALTETLCPDNRRVAEPIDEDIYLMRKASCRAVLVECGFLSNPEELERLKSETYETKLALVMLGAYMQYIRGTTI